MGGCTEGPDGRTDIETGFISVSGLNIYHIMQR